MYSSIENAESETLKSDKFRFTALKSQVQSVKSQNSKMCSL